RGHYYQYPGRAKDMSGHAVLSPSSAYRWLSAGCPGSPAVNHGKEDNSIYADEGTPAHALHVWCLPTGHDGAQFPHPVLHGLADGSAFHGSGQAAAPIRNSFDADDEMREHIQVVVDDIRRHAKGNEIIAEQRVSFAATLGVPPEFGSGTADARVRDDAE